MTLNKLGAPNPNPNSTAVAERGRVAAGEHYRPF